MKPLPRWLYNRCHIPLWLKLSRAAAACLAIVLAAVAIVGLWRSIPGGDNPFIGFGLNHGLGVHTRAKLAELQSMPDQCQLALSRSQLEYTAIPDRQEGDFCAFEGVVRMDESQVDYSSPAQVTCPLAAALYVWEREVLQPLAREHLGAEVRRIQHVGTYACRRVYGGRLGEPSQHARANAIDMIGFTLDDGGAVSVVNHWDDSGAKGSFLRRLHARSCSVFNGVLGPEYNAYHRDHLHIDLGPYNVCE